MHVFILIIEVVTFASAKGKVRFEKTKFKHRYQTQLNEYAIIRLCPFSNFGGGS